MVIVLLCIKSAKVPFFCFCLDFIFGYRLCNIFSFLVKGSYSGPVARMVEWNKGIWAWLG